MMTLPPPPPSTPPAFVATFTAPPPAFEWAVASLEAFASGDAGIAAYDRADAELARDLRRRATRRAAADRPASPLDALAMKLRRLRTALAEAAAVAAESDDRRAPALVARSYRFATKLAAELESVERRDLDPSGDWAELERLAPPALASFDAGLAQLVGAPCARDVAPLASVVAALESVRAELRAARRAACLAA